MSNVKKGRKWQSVELQSVELQSVKLQSVKLQSVKLQSVEFDKEWISSLTFAFIICIVSNISFKCITSLNMYVYDGKRTHYCISAPVQIFITQNSKDCTKHHQHAQSHAWKNMKETRNCLLPEISIQDVWIHSFIVLNDFILWSSSRLVWGCYLCSREQRT